jgi:hypothetical protein
MISSALWLFVFFILDSLWYGQPTLAFFNFLKFNVLQYDLLGNITYIYSRNQSYLFGMHSRWKYVDCFLRDNNILVFLGTILAIWKQPQSRGYCAPYISLIIAFDIDNYTNSNLWIPSIYESKARAVLVFLVPYTVFCL